MTVPRAIIGTIASQAFPIAYKYSREAHTLNTSEPVPAGLSAALRTYYAAFGHEVPAEIVAKYATRCGPLMLEIRQAVELRKPVPAWFARSKVINPLV
ncbi:MAG: hypothetical protein ACT4UQ_05935 [Gammaproteobacteria bacterium]